MMKTKLIPWLAPLVVLLCTAGCPVSINEGGGDDGDDGPSTAECPPAQLATVRIFHGAGGTPVDRPPFGPSTTPNLNVVRTDLDADDPPIVASLVAGRAATVQICGNKPLVLGARLASAEKDRATLMITLTPDADPAKLDIGTTLVLAGIADDVKPDPSDPSMEIGENPASAANPLQFIEVPEKFSTEGDAQMQVVHASRVTPTPIDVETDPDSAGSEITALERYKVSGIVSTKGSPDTAPIAVPVVFKSGTSAGKTFTIARIPTGAKVLVIHFDNEVYDPANPDPAKRTPAPTPRLFLTGDDPLLGRVAGGGVTI